MQLNQTDNVPTVLVARGFQGWRAVARKPRFSFLSAPTGTITPVPIYRGMERTDLEPRQAVLIVDDEPILRMVASDFADDAGFCAIEAANADEALKILEGNPDICLIFTDVQMPGSMDGLKLASAVHLRWPQIAIIVTSGRATPIRQDLPPNAAFLSKPYDPKKLCATMRSRVAA